MFLPWYLDNQFLNDYGKFTAEVEAESVNASKDLLKRVYGISWSEI